MREERSDDVRRRPKDRKQQILIQARDLFVELGYRNVTMGQIASRVGIAPSALYRHFANKAVLLEAVIDESFGDLVFPADGVPLSEVFEQASALGVSRPLGLLWSREARHLPEERQDAVRATLRRAADGYVRLLERERPDLSAEQLDLQAWGILSVMASPGYRSGRRPAGETAARLVAASRAIVEAPLQESRTTQDHDSRTLQPMSRRERLLLAAMGLFAERGYQETSLDDIGAKADVTGPNLYSYFENKAAVLRAVIERGTHAMWIDLEDVLRRHSDPASALDGLASAYVRRQAAGPSLGRQLTGEVEIEDLARSYQREYVAEWAGLLRSTRLELDESTARDLVHIALVVADNLTATRHLRASTTFVEDLAAVVRAVLHA
jgi:AcrR family transcriptional regulator